MLSVMSMTQMPQKEKICNISKNICEQAVCKEQAYLIFSLRYEGVAVTDNG